MDPQKYPVEVIIPPQERSSRVLALLFLLFIFPKVLLLIPHFIVLYILGTVSFLLTIIAQIIVLVTGHYPSAIYTIVSGTIRWQARVRAYFLGLVDTYPPFSFK